MDPRLAEIYGTNEDNGDVEKTAAAELAEKLAEENEMDVDNLSDEDIEALAQEVLSSDEESKDGEDVEENAEEKTASENEESDTTEEKLAEADYLGRVMAHSYVQELKNIEKTAAKGGGVVAKLRNLGAAGKAKGVKHGKAALKAVMKHGKAALKAGKKHGKAMAGAGAVGAGAGFMAGRKSKESSALDTLAQQRAVEILKENGVEFEEKQASDDQKWDVLSQAVEARAIEMLKSEGYEFEDEKE